MVAGHLQEKKGRFIWYYAIRMKTIKPNYVSQHYSLILEKNHLRKITFHELRHSCASLLLASGVSMKEIQEWLGHSTFSTTADIYAHLDVSAKEGTGAAMMSKIDISGSLPATRS